MLSRVAVPLTCFFVGSVVCWVLWLHRDTLCCFWPHFPAVAQMHLTRTKYACCWFTENVVLLQLIKLRDCFCADNRFSFKNIFRRKKKKHTLSFRKLRGCKCVSSCVTGVLVSSEGVLSPLPWGDMHFNQNCLHRRISGWVSLSACGYKPLIQSVSIDSWWHVVGAKFA